MLMDYIYILDIVSAFQIEINIFVYELIFLRNLASHS